MSLTLAEFDFSGQEFRWMAVASKDETMLSLCAPGEDAHSYMGAQIALVDYRELIQRVHAEDKEAENQRKLGKFCVAEGELVLTDFGLIPIEKVSLAHRVWDGVEWVSHSGVVYQGEKEVLTYGGITLTPDHQVYLEKRGTLCFGQAVAKGYLLAVSGHGRYPVQRSQDSIHGDPARRENSQGGLSLQMRAEVVGEQGQPCQQQNDSMQGVCVPAKTCERGACDHQRSSDGQGTETVQCNEAEMHQPEGSIVQELWRAGDSVQFSNSRRGDSVYFEGTPSPDVSQPGHRPERERQALRTRESSPCASCCESSKQTEQQERTILGKRHPSESCISCLTNALAGRKIYIDSSMQLGKSRAESGGNSGQVSSTIKLQTKRVYDVTNAGPRHRYTVSGYLISNSNLSFQYRISAPKATVKARVEYGLNVTEAFIKGVQTTYLQSYRGIQDYWRNQVMRCKQQGYAETYAGRRVQLKGSWVGRDKWGLESTSINYPIQGTGADQKYLALAILRDYLPQIGGRLYFELHDGLFLLLPTATVLVEAPKIKHILSNLPYKQAWGVDLPIQFPVDCKLSDTSWGDLKELKE